MLEALTESEKARRATTTGRPRETKGKGLPTIVYFDHTAMMSGGEIALLNLLTTLDRTRFTPVVVLSEEGPLANKVAEAGIEVHIIPLAKTVSSTRKDSLKASSLLKIGAVFASVAYSFKLASFLQYRKTDLIHTNSLKADILGGFAGRIARVPVLWHIRDRISNDYLPGIVVKAFRLLCRVLPNYIIANSHSTMQTLAKAVSVPTMVVHSGSHSGQLRVVHDGILEKDLIKSEFNSENPIIGLVGRISSWKGQHIFIDAAASILRWYPNARFEIIGSAMFGELEYESSIREQVKSLGISDSITFAGFCEDIAAKINSLDILVHASTSAEPFGQVVVEGMVAGKPVIATAGGGVLEIVEDCKTGYLVPMGDSDAMAIAICKLLEDPQAATEMGLRGRERVLSHFTIEITTRKIQDIYSEFFG